MALPSRHSGLSNTSHASTWIARVDIDTILPSSRAGNPEFGNQQQWSAEEEENDDGILVVVIILTLVLVEAILSAH